MTKFWQKIASQLEEGNLQDAHGIENEIKDNNNYSDQSDDKSCKYVMQNALVLIICISKYDSDEYDDLKGAVRDMDALKRLWVNFFVLKLCQMITIQVKTIIRTIQLQTNIMYQRMI